MVIWKLWEGISQSFTKPHISAEGEFGFSDCPWEITAETEFTIVVINTSCSQHLNPANITRIQFMMIPKSLVVAICLGTASIASSSWPSSKEWSNLNSTVHGRLFASVPLSRPCFTVAKTRGNFNLTQCSVVQDHYSDRCEWFDFNTVNLLNLHSSLPRHTVFSLYER